MDIKMKRVNALIIYLIIVSVIMFIGLLLVSILPFAAGLFVDNAVAILLFIAISCAFTTIAVLMTVYYMLSLVTSITVQNDKLIVAVFLKVYSFSFDEIDLKDLSGGKYQIISKKQEKFTLYIKLLDADSLKTLFKAIERIP